mmetsp:Transcript_53108/g.128938  ORF Transcript_53108/g.128938 Transcript_53108/m.128938 type:complete len:419 (-) Transcript_53108:420-1676(-)
MTTSSAARTSLHSSQDMNEDAQTPPPPVETKSDSPLHSHSEKRRGRSSKSSSSTAAARVLTLSAGLLLCLQQLQSVQAWGNSNSNSGESSFSLYGNGFTRDWLYDSSSIAFKVEGCAWGLVEDSEEVGCLQDESEDGTTNWYMMANCRRPQVIYSVYASSSGSASCNDNSFVGSFVTTIGVSEFLGYLATYDANFPNNGNDDGYGYDGLPECYQSDSGYLGVDCSDSKFVLGYFDDQYCMARTGTVADNLNSVNSIVSNYQSCTAVTVNNNDGGDGNGGNQASLISSLLYYSTPCTSFDYNLCQDYYNFDERSNGVSRASGLSASSFSNSVGSHQSWVTKLKYAIGGMFLLASFIMFTGILFTNRRRRRAMMMRKYRQAKRAKKEKERDGTSRKSSRSKSRRRSKSRSKKEEGDGIFT